MPAKQNSDSAKICPVEHLVCGIIFFVQKKLLIYRDGVHIRTVTYAKAHGVWTATHFFQYNYMPDTLYAPLSEHRTAMEEDSST